MFENVFRVTCGIFFMQILMKDLGKIGCRFSFIPSSCKSSNVASIHKHTKALGVLILSYTIFTRGYLWNVLVYFPLSMHTIQFQMHH